MTGAVLLAGCVLLPLTLAAVVLGLPEGRSLKVLPFAALPAFPASLLEIVPHAELPPSLLGAQLALDTPGRLFLLLAAVVWTLAGWFAAGYVAGRRRRFAFSWLLAVTGTMTVVLAADVVTFYAGFAVLTFSAVGLVAHERTSHAYRATRTYVVMSVFGEVLILSALLLLMAEPGVTAPTMALADVPETVAASGARDLIVAGVLAGFGVKAGALGVHVWLPLAHPVAPTPASAVLSGCVIKAGLLGWLRFLPLGEGVYPGWGTALVVLGFLGALFGVAAGLCQRGLKELLAYSSVSQVGLMTVIVGVGLLGAGAELVVGAAAVFALHHGVAKHALFLFTGATDTRLGGGIVAAAALPAAALAGAPFTSGAAAKTAVKEVAETVGGLGDLGLALSLTSIATTGLMVHFLQLLGGKAAGEGSGQSGGGSVHGTRQRGLIAPSLAAVGGTAVATWMATAVLPTAAPVGWPIADVAWPVIVGAGLALLAFSAGRRWGIALPEIPAGDVLVLGERALGRLGAVRGAAVRAVGRARPALPAIPPVARLAARADGLFTPGKVIAVVAATVVVALVVSAAL